MHRTTGRSLRTSVGDWWNLEAQWDAERGQLHAKIGEQALHIDVLKKAHRIVGKDLPEGIS